MKPMLASPTDGTGLTYPLLVSPKLDGVRCLIINGTAMSRSLKPIPNTYIQRAFGRRELNGLDGELIVGHPTDSGVFQRTMSGVMKHDGIPKAYFHVFDTFLGDHNFAERLKLAHHLAHQFVSVFKVPHDLIKTEAELYTQEQKHLAHGYEGIMLRDPHGPYKHGRSTLKEGWLLKLKRFLDSEAEVLDWKPLLHNTNEATTGELGQTKRSSHKAGMVAQELLGALIVRDLKTGVEFEIGTGFDMVQRASMWKTRGGLAGQVLKYKYQPVGVKDKPRFPVFLGWRDRRDL